jgi:predicted nuclease with TOPRIM domain
MDIIFEKAFLEKLAHSKYADFADKMLEEQNQIKSSILKDLLHRDQGELETMQNNSDNFRVETADFEMMMKKKLSSLKRKIDVKNYVIKQLAPRN